MIDIRKFDTLGHANHGWLDAKHHFSFAGYHDPARMGWGSLRVWNDDELVNTHGVAVVSKMNRQLGVRLADRLRGLGAVTRWRSHEFVVALPGQTLEAGTHLLNTILSQAETTDFPLGDSSVSFQVVAGATLMQNAGDSLEGALRQCNQCLDGVDGASQLVHSKEMATVAVDAEEAEKWLAGLRDNLARTGLRASVAAEDVRRFLLGIAGEVATFDDPRQSIAVLGELLERASDAQARLGPLPARVGPAGQRPAQPRTQGRIYQLRRIATAG